MEHLEELVGEITDEHEKILDEYEGFPKTYQKEYFYLDKKKVMFYIKSKYFIKEPPQSYVNTIKQGLIDCKLDDKFLIKALEENKKI